MTTADEHEHSLHELLTTRRIPPQPNNDLEPPTIPDHHKIPPHEQALGLANITQIRTLIDQAKTTRHRWSKTARKTKTTEPDEEPF